MEQLAISTEVVDFLTGCKKTSKWDGSTVISRYVHSKTKLEGLLKLNVISSEERKKNLRKGRILWLSWFTSLIVPFLVLTPGLAITYTIASALVVRLATEFKSWTKDIDYELNLAALRSYPETYIRVVREYNEVVESPLNKFRYLTYKFATALENSVSRFNHLVTGISLGSISEDREETLRRISPILKKSLEQLVHCVKLYNWHTDQAKYKDAEKLPSLGILLQEIDEAINLLEVARLEHGSEMEDDLLREIALIELQKDLGEIPAFNL